MPRREDYLGAARGIASYLAERQRPDGSFPGPEQYGIAFALWLWSCFGVEYVRQLDRAWQYLKDHPPGTHGEFAVYALLQCRESLGAGPVDALIRKIAFGARHSANWMLLRAVCQLSEGPCRWRSAGIFEGRVALLRYARYGLICDRPGVRSFSYHAFCGALLADIWRRSGLRWAGRAALNAAYFLRPFILPNGDALYLGRGQQQIFGYGALIYLLEMAVSMTGEEDFADAAEAVFAHLMHYQRADGSFPLVLTEGEEPEPWRPDATRPGWYTYSRYADYLPFLGCWLWKAAQVEAAPSKATSLKARLRPHPDFFIVERPIYTAILARPAGSPTSDLAFPYCWVDGQSLFPCYGREGDRVEASSMPLPYFVTATGEEYNFREQLHYQLKEERLVGVSPMVRHSRQFTFERDGFTCIDEIIFNRRRQLQSFAPVNFLFRTLRAEGAGEYETWHRGVSARIVTSEPVELKPDAAVSASGRLVALRQTIPNYETQAGVAYRTELRVKLA